MRWPLGLATLGGNRFSGLVIQKLGVRQHAITTQVVETHWALWLARATAETHKGTLQGCDQTSVWQPLMRVIGHVYINRHLFYLCTSVNCSPSGKSDPVSKDYCSKL